MKNKSLSSLKVLEDLIFQMEERGVDNPEYIVRNIQLIDKIINILKEFQLSLEDKIGKT